MKEKHKSQARGDTCTKKGFATLWDHASSLNLEASKKNFVRDICSSNCWCSEHFLHGRQISWDAEQESLLLMPFALLIIRLLSALQTNTYSWESFSTLTRPTILSVQESYATKNHSTRLHLRFTVENRAYVGLASHIVYRITRPPKTQR